MQNMRIPIFYCKITFCMKKQTYLCNKKQNSNIQQQK